MSVSPQQIKAARLLLDWTPERLADEAGVAVGAVSVVEGDDSAISADDMSIVASALEAAGIEFIGSAEGGPGVTLRKDAGSARP